MSGGDQFPSPVSSLERIRLFLAWHTPATLVFTLGAALVFGLGWSSTAGAAALVGLADLAALLLARAQLGRGRPRLALIPICLGLLLVALAFVSFWPFLLPSLVLAPIIVVLLAMPHLPARALLSLSLGCWTLMLLLLLLGETAPAAPSPPSPLGPLVRVLALGLSGAVVLLLLWQSSHQLLELVHSARRANVSLRAAQSALEAEHAQLFTTLQCIADGVIAADARGRVTRFNAAAAALTGWPQDAVVGRSLWEVLSLRRADSDAPLAFSPTDAPPADSLADPAHPVLLLSRTGRRLPVEVRVAPLRLETGEFQGLVVVLRDLTVRLNAEEERLTWQRNLSELQRWESLGLLASSVTHDFNNLLTVVLGNTQLALLDIEESSPACQTLGSVITATAHASALTRQMLSYAGRGHSSSQLVDLNGLVSQMTPLLHSAVGKAVSLSLELAPQLPMLEADPTQLRQVIMNLIINASEAIGAEGGSILLSTEQVADAGGEPQIVLRVRDTGCGMDAETQRRIFEPFFSTKFAGRGLGLASVLGIVRGHRGELAVESVPGQGTTFTVSLPASSAARPKEQAPLELLPWRGDGTVLVIDDEDQVRSTVARMLQHYGLHVLSAPDGAAGLALFQMVPDDIVCVLLDITMRGMPAAEVIARLRQIRPGVRVVLMSGNQPGPLEGLAPDQTPVFLSKPFSLAELGATLRRALEHAGERVEG
jgi:PAS domain S-box-containing protein